LSASRGPPFTALSRQGGYAHTLKGYFYINLGGTLVIAFLEAQPIEKSWKELIVSQAGDEGIGRIAAEAGELMLNSQVPVAGAILGTVFSRLCEEARAA
jgi:hypothetical protein